MSMSVDYQKLERVDAFSRFLDLLADPEDMKKQLAEYKTNAQLLADLIQKKAKIDNIDQYVEDEKKKLAQEYVALDEAKAAFEKVKEVALENIRVTTERTSKSADQTSVRLKEAEELQAANKKALDETTAARVALEKERVALEAARKEAETRAADLAEKQEALKKVLGG